MMQSSVKPSRKAVSDTWDQVYQTSNVSLAQARLDREQKSLRWRTFSSYLAAQYADQTLRCVELGCGEGDFSVLLAQMGHRVTLVDFSQAALDRARARFAHLGLDGTFIETDLFDFADQQAGQFDVSCSLGVVEHFSGALRSKIIEAHRRVLHQQGVTFISAPHAYCPAYRLWKKYLELRNCWPYGFEAPFTTHQINRLAKQVGFGTCETYKSGFAASLDGCLMLPMTGKRRHWLDGPRWANRLWGWDINLIGQAA